MTAPGYCQHGRIGDACEQCAFTRGQAEGRIAPGAALYPPTGPQRRTADADLDVPVADGATVHVRAGDPIPPDLLDAAHQAQNKGKGKTADPVVA